MQNIKLLQDLQNRALCGEELIDLMPELVNAEYLASLANAAYRAGEPIVEDWFYDQYLIESLRIINPESDFLQEVEPEPEGEFGKTVPLPQPMLSTQKAYSVAEIEKWCDSVIEASRGFGFSEKNTRFRITPKLDGFAAYSTGWGALITRGNGLRGTDISRALHRGLMIEGDAGIPGPGEIVVDRNYFAAFLAESFENSRNVIASVIKEGSLEPIIKEAIDDHAVMFIKFSALNGWVRNKDELLRDLEEIWAANLASSQFDTDGLVIETMCKDVKHAMGATNHHHRWQIAYKKNTEFHDIRVTGLTWQTGKSGKITPVVELEPTKVSGVTISRATGHHYGNVVKNGIAKGAIVKVCRSGRVIPFIEKVVSGVLPPESDWCEVCPSCKSPVEVRGDFLHCTNESTCPAQVERTIEHFFKTIGNCDGFGPKIIEQLCGYGMKTVSGIYGMDIEDMSAAGISQGVVGNLLTQLDRSCKEQIEDWRFLAAFSIPSVGKGGCEKLLKHHRIEGIFSLTVDDIVRIDGFAEKTASVLVETLQNIKPQFDRLFPLFNLKRTSIGGSTTESPIAGKTIVFTGAMQKGSRDQMEKEAKLLGAKVGSSVSGKTDYLVAGLNVGANKTAAARKHGVKVLTEDEYLQLIDV